MNEHPVKFAPGTAGLSHGGLACGSCGATPLVAAVATAPEARCELFFGDLGGMGFRGEDGGEPPEALVRWMAEHGGQLPEVRCGACGAVLVTGREG